MPEMNWDRSYDTQGAVWGTQPGELAIFACEYLGGSKLPDGFEIADLGCGYGRDVLYLAKTLGCSVTGIDSSPKAIALAYESCPPELTGRVNFQVADFDEMEKPYPAIFASNLYQVLPVNERARLVKSIDNHLQPDGFLFLNALSTHDPEEYGRGVPVAGEDNSFEREKFLHFCTRAELEKEFSFLEIERLFEHEYLEPHPGAATHHHISWIMAAKKPAKSN
jgi:cyclopropane fatty-acyl-phospholipid synthase-like methyltransferase